MAVFIADIDLKDRKMERPFDRRFVEADTEDEARVVAAEKVVDHDEELRGVRPLQPILDRVLAAPGGYSISWKDEGEYGPVFLTDLSKQTEGTTSVPFGSEFPGVETLPWQTHAEARRLARYLGLTLEES